MQTLFGMSCPSFVCLMFLLLLQTDVHYHHQQHEHHRAKVVLLYFFCQSAFLPPTGGMNIQWTQQYRDKGSNMDYNYTAAHKPSSEFKTWI